MAKKSLAEQIAELSKPQTEFDIEDNDLRENAFGNGSEDDMGSEPEASDADLKTDHYVKVLKSNLRRDKDSIALGGKYTGSVADRSSIYGNMAGNRPTSDSEDEEDEEDEGQESSDDDEEEDGNDEDDNDDIEEEEDNEIDDHDGSLDNSDVSDEDSNGDAERAKLKAMMSKERDHIVSRMSQASSNDSLKGYAILQQHSLFDNILDIRLKVQKAVSNSNMLPADARTLKKGKFSTKNTTALLDDTISKGYDLLDSILALRSSLADQDGISTKPLPHTPKKRSLPDYLEVSQQQDAVLNGYRASVLTKWSSKIQNSSGSSAINSGKFRAINQLAEQQVQNNISDMARLVKKTKLNRRQIKPLGYEYSKAQAAAEEEEEEEENPDIPKEQHSKSQASELAELDQIFDDEDFYRVLLNDLVDKKVQSSNPTTGLTIALRGAQQAHKLKKNVDTKASKGRKLRYHVQEPIANFDAPRPGLKWNDDQIDEFFASLLGQKVNMNEAQSEDESEDEEVANGADGIQLFG